MSLGIAKVERRAGSDKDFGAKPPGLGRSDYVGSEAKNKKLVMPDPKA